MKRDVVVIGAGLIGITTAWYLAKRGFNVTVLERRDSCGIETSFANGALLTPSEADPWNAPGTLVRLLRWLGREESPLLLRPRALPGMLDWGLKFLRASRPAPYLRSTIANLRLAIYSLGILDELEKELSLNYDRLHSGTLKIFRDRKALNQALELAAVLRPLGLEARPLSPEEAIGLEPMLESVSQQLVGAIYYPKDGSGDAYRFTCEMHAHALAAGVNFHFNTSVSQIHARGRCIQALHTEQGEISADHYVLAAGSHSPQLVRGLGLKLPIYPVKGYSVTVTSASSHNLGTPLVDFEHKIVLAPLGKRIRIAGTAEFNGYDTTLNPKRGANILRQAISILPWLAEAAQQGKVTHWAGLRPMSCDGPPILGACSFTNLFLNTGHGPLGWTLGAGSARCVADLVAGLKPAIDMSAYSVGRFEHNT
ncbi:MAG: D-amino acid dehydrogenase [Gammaproteobacteria bacterium]